MEEGRIPDGRPGAATVAWPCLAVAQVFGLIAMAIGRNVSGVGTGVWQVVLGGGVPAGISFLAARHAGRTPLEAGAWAVASMATTAVVIGAFILYVIYVIDPR
jgi:hypothetical protein